MSFIDKRLKFDHCFKIILVGNVSVGKSSLLSYLDNETFPTFQKPTVWVDLLTKFISLQDKTIKMQIWDTAGQEKFNDITKTYYKAASGIILIYDWTDRNSYDDVSNWMK